MKTTADISSPETLTEAALATVQGGTHLPTTSGTGTWIGALPDSPFLIPGARIGLYLTQADLRALNAPPPPVYTDPNDARSFVFPE